MTQEKFEQTIIEAVETLPEKIKKKIENVGFVMEEEVRSAKLEEQGIKFKETLLGLYQGVPLSRRGPNYFLVLPDKITLFKKSIEQLAGYNDQRTKDIIHQVVYHEIAHYFGMAEPEVRQWEKKKKKS